MWYKSRILKYLRKIKFECCPISKRGLRNHFTLHDIDVVSMGVHFRIARGARVSWFPSNDLADTSPLHYIHSIYRRWVVYRWADTTSRKPPFSTRGRLPWTCAGKNSSSSATHLVSSKIGLSRFPWGLNRSFSFLNTVQSDRELWCPFLIKFLLGFRTDKKSSWGISTDQWGPKWSPSWEFF